MFFSSPWTQTHDCAPASQRLPLSYIPSPLLPLRQVVACNSSWLHRQCSFYQLLNAGITGMHYHAWLTMDSFEYIQREQYDKSISSGFSPVNNR